MSVHVYLCETTKSLHRACRWDQIWVSQFCSDFVFDHYSIITKMSVALMVHQYSRYCCIHVGSMFSPLFCLLINPCIEVCFSFSLWWFISISVSFSQFCVCSMLLLCYPCLSGLSYVFVLFAFFMNPHLRAFSLPAFWSLDLLSLEFWPACLFVLPFFFWLIPTNGMKTDGFWGV